MLANMPNGIAGRKFGQGLPPVSVTLKKLSENGRDSKSKFKKFDKKHQYFQDFSSNFHTWPLYARAKQRSSILQSCAEALRATHKKLWAKKWQKHQFWDQKSSIWSTKSVSIKKRQQGLVLTLAFGGRMQNLRRIVWSSSEIVIFFKKFLSVSYELREGQQDPTRWPKYKWGETPPPT